MEKTIRTYKDSKMKEIVETACRISPTMEHHLGMYPFREILNMNHTELTWKFICKRFCMTNMIKHALALLCASVETGNYTADDKEMIFEMEPVIRSLVDDPKTVCKKVLLCGKNLDGLIFVSRSTTYKEKMKKYVIVENSTPFITGLLRAFLVNCTSEIYNYATQDNVSFFADSFGNKKHTLSSYKDFTGELLIKQVEMYRKHYPYSQSKFSQSVHFVLNFYRWLVNEYTLYDFFSNSTCMTKQLLFSTSISRLLINGTFILPFDPNNPPYGHSDFCFILRDSTVLSTNAEKEDYRHFTLTGLKSVTYLNALIDYMMAHPSLIATNNGCSMIYPMRDGLILFEEMKSQKNYPNPDFKNFVAAEGVFLKESIAMNPHLSIVTLNNRIGANRRFFLWCKEAGILNVEDTFFDQLIQYEEPSLSTAKSIPVEHLSKIAVALSEKSKTDYMAMLSYAIMHILLQTEFRISQICKLRVDCIQPTAKLNEYMIVSNGKTSHGAKDHYVITSLTYHVLMNTIEQTEKVRECCNIESHKDYIFLYQGNNRSTKVFSYDQFSEELRKICKNLGIPCYTAASFRDTHMTQALEYAIRNNRSDIELSVLTRHKRIDTTKNHYVDFVLEKMLESTYGITIGDERINTDVHVVDKIPDSIDNDAHTVEGGCGKCRRNICNMTGPLPCLTCHDFLTTEDYEPNFIKAIEAIDRQIQSAPTPHDKDDLVTIKTIYVAWLKEIYKHTEGKS